MSDSPGIPFPPSVYTPRGVTYGRNHKILRRLSVQGVSTFCLSGRSFAHQMSRLVMRPPLLSPRGHTLSPTLGSGSSGVGASFPFVPSCSNDRPGVGGGRPCRARGRGVGVRARSLAVVVYDKQERGSCHVAPVTE